MWTPTALASEFRRYRRTVWRVVEAQHRISTNRLTSDLGEQKRLEELADSAKPDLPKTAHGLHYLLASPFRYGHTVASRFRRANERPGIFYASEAEGTAITAASRRAELEGPESEGTGEGPSCPRTVVAAAQSTPMAATFIQDLIILPGPSGPAPNGPLQLGP